MFAGALALAESDRPSVFKGNQLEERLWSSLEFTVSDKIKLEKGIPELTPGLQGDRLFHLLVGPNETTVRIRLAGD